EALGELDELSRGLGQADPAADDDNGPLRAIQELRRGRDEHRVTGRPKRSRQWPVVGDLRLGAGYIARDLDENRPRLAVLGEVEGTLERPRRPVGEIETDGPLADRAREVQRRCLLEDTHAFVVA